MNKNILKFFKVNFIVANLIAFSAVFAPALANDAVILLNQMNNALHTLEYQGKLVYLKDGEASNLSIRHTLEKGAEKEVIAPLDENGDEYIKESNAFSLSGIPKITPQMQQVYSFDLGGMSKVAGRPCRIVLARPKDRKRYLQKYCIDLDRSVLLKYSLINQHHEPVERFMFTDFEVISTEKVVEEKTESDSLIELDASVKSVEPQSNSKMKMANSFAPGSTELLAEGDDISSEEIKAVVDTKDDLSSSTKSKSSPDNYSEWFFDPLPTGFHIVSADKVKNPKGEDEQIIISDGLSSVSVFISTGTNADEKNVAKQYKPIQSGALNILSEVYQGRSVTLVGEVPKSTLQDIFKGIKKATIKE
ncbi:MAG: MucB/RseB C-terminal domain-containing protein [Thiotrichaceae bacterium]